MSRWSALLNNPKSIQPIFIGNKQNMANITLIYGTVMGTSHGVAMALQKQLTEDGHQVSLHSDDAHTSLQRPADLIVVCTSNTGAGDLPQNLAGLYQHLTTDFPRLAEQPFAMINLGDSAYPTFGEAGHRLREAFTELGAQEITPMLTIDAGDGLVPQTLALEWYQQWKDQFCTY